MSNCSPTLEVVEVPGGPGGPGINGTNGLNAFDFLQASLVVPAVTVSVAAIILDNSRFTVGQNIFLEGAGTFSLDSKAGTTVLNLTYLNYASNVNTGATIPIGAQLSPGGYEATIPNPLTVALGGTGGTTAATARANLGLLPIHAGTFTMNGVTPVAVSDANVTASSCFAFGLKTVGGTVGAAPSVKTTTVGAGFTVAGTAADTSIYNYQISG